MKTVDNAGVILRRSATAWLAYIATGLEFIGLVWPLMQEHVEVIVEPTVFHTLAAVSVICIPLARVIKQESLR